MNALRRSTIFLPIAALLSVTALPAFAAPTHDASLRGRVFGADLATPVAGLDVQAFPEGSAVPAARASTDARGRFVLEGLAEGAHLLLLSHGTGEPLAAAEVMVTRSSRDQVVSLAIPDEEEEAAEGSGSEAAPGKGGFKAWLKTPLGATVGIIVSAIVLAFVADEVTDDNPRAAESRILP